MKGLKYLSPTFYVEKNENVQIPVEKKSILHRMSLETWVSWGPHRQYQVW